MSIAGAILELVGLFVVEIAWHFACYGVGRCVLAVVSAGRMTSSLDGEPPPGPAETRSRYVEPDVVRLIGVLTVALALAACVLTYSLQ